MAMTARSTLMSDLQRQIRERRWTQRRTALERGVSQPRVCHLMGSRIGRFSSDALILLPGRHGIDITMSAKPRASGKAARRSA